jgi:hypothetical protein
MIGSSIRSRFPTGSTERAAPEAHQLGRKKMWRHTAAGGSPPPAIGRRSRGDRRPTRRIARESEGDSHATRETTSRPSPRPPAQSTRTPLASSQTYCGAVPGVATAYQRSATSLRTTRLCGTTAERNYTFYDLRTYRLRTTDATQWHAA